MSNPALTPTPFAYADVPSADSVIYPTHAMYTHRPTFVPEFVTLQELIPEMASQAQIARRVDRKADKEVAPHRTRSRHDVNQLTHINSTTHSACMSVCHCVTPQTFDETDIYVSKTDTPIIIDRSNLQFILPPPEKGKVAALPIFKTGNTMI
jgi:hypothetical protein